MFQRGNLTVLVRSTGSISVHVDVLAKALDDDLTGGPGAPAGIGPVPIGPVPGFSLTIEIGSPNPQGWFRVRLQGGDPDGGRVWFRLESPTGSLRRLGPALFYRPAQPGPQQVVCIARSTTGRASVQQEQWTI